MRARSLASTPVRLKYAVGKRAERCALTYWAASSARNFPTVICGLFLSASASACLRLKGVPADAAPCAGGFAVVAGGIGTDGVCAYNGNPAHNSKPSRYSFLRVRLR